MSNFIKKNTIIYLNHKMCYNNNMDEKLYKNQITNMDNIKYHIFDPTKNITILVETIVDINDQPKIAKSLMDKNPSTEQVGFVKFDTDGNTMLRMAGGEFCGNATMCAGIYAALNNDDKFSKCIKKIYVDALDKFIDVEVKRIDENTFVCVVNMPHAKSVKKIKFSNDEIYEIVELDGISHIIVDIENYEKENKNLNFDINNINFKKYFEDKIKKISDFLNINSLGIIFYDKKKNNITPLVYVKNADTVYWENSCASGSIATYEYLKYKYELSNVNNDTNKKTGLRLYQPCKEYLEIFEINNKLYLTGTVKIINQ